MYLGLLSPFCSLFFKLKLLIHACFHIFGQIPIRLNVRQPNVHPARYLSIKCPGPIKTIYVK